MIKRIALILAVVVAGIMGAAIVATPAQAAPTCPVTYICWFDSNNWQGTKYVADPWSLPSGTCFNMSYDPNTGINWNDLADSVWWNDSGSPGSYVEFYEGANCTIRAVTRANAYGPTYDQMQSCLEPAAVWNGPCGPPNNVAKRISSWAFAW